MKKVVAVLSVILILAGLGCATLSHMITPGEVDKSAVKYVVDAGVAEPNEYKGYGNLLKATKLKEDVKAAHITNQLELAQAAQRENLEHSIHEKSTFNNHHVAVQREEQLFGTTGLVSLGLSMAGFGSLTGLLGLARKRPGDITKPEMEQALATVTGKTKEELSLKEKQFVQLVKGVQEFMDAPRKPEEAEALKRYLDKHQDRDTQVAVAAAKVG